VAGIAPGARVLPYAHGAAVRASTGAEGIRWAVDNGAQVLNLSWGVDARTPPPALVGAVEYALAADVVVVASAGNLAGGSTEVAWPARVPGVIAVTGLGRDGRFWAEGSVQGEGAVLAAPAEDVITPAPTVPSGYGKGSGTSPAAAIVSGVAAMVRAEFPDLDAAGVVERLVSTAVDAGPPGWDGQYGRGVVDPVAALTADVAPVDRNPLLPPPAEDPAPDAPAAAAPGGGPAPAAPAVQPWLLVPLAVVVVLAALVLLLVARRRRRRPPAVPPPPWSGRAPPPRIPFPRGYDPPTQPHVPAQRPYRAAPPHPPAQPHGAPRRPAPPRP
jgi:hypothetical protein